MVDNKVLCSFLLLLVPRIKVNLNVLSVHEIIFINLLNLVQLNMKCTSQSLKNQGKPGSVDMAA